MTDQITREVEKILAAFATAVEESECVSTAATKHIKRMVSDGKMAEPDEIDKLVALLKEGINGRQD